MSTFSNWLSSIKTKLLATTMMNAPFETQQNSIQQESISSDTTEFNCDDALWFNQSLSYLHTIPISTGFHLAQETNLGIQISIDAHSLFLKETSEEATATIEIPSLDPSNNKFVCHTTVEQVQLHGPLFINVMFLNFQPISAVTERETRHTTDSSFTLFSNHQTIVTNTVLGYTCHHCTTTEKRQYKLYLFLANPYLVLHNGTKVYAYDYPTSSFVTQPLSQLFIDALNGRTSQQLCLPFTFRMNFDQKVFQTLIFSDAVYEGALPNGYAKITLTRQI